MHASTAGYRSTGDIAARTRRVINDERRVSSTVLAFSTADSWQRRETTGRSALQGSARISQIMVEAAGVEPFGFIFLDEYLLDSSRQTARTVPADSPQRTQSGSEVAASIEPIGAAIFLPSHHHAPLSVNTASPSSLVTGTSKWYVAHAGLKPSIGMKHSLKCSRAITSVQANLVWAIAIGATISAPPKSTLPAGGT